MCTVLERHDDDVISIFAQCSIIKHPVMWMRGKLCPISQSSFFARLCFWCTLLNIDITYTVFGLRWDFYILYTYTCMQHTHLSCWYSATLFNNVRQFSPGILKPIIQHYSLLHRFIEGWLSRNRRISIIQTALYLVQTGFRTRWHKFL